MLYSSDDKLFWQIHFIIQHRMNLFSLQMSRHVMLCIRSEDIFRYRRMKLNVLKIVKFYPQTSAF